MIETEFEKAFRDLFKTTIQHAFSVVRDEDTAKDIVLQVFIKPWGKKNSPEIRSDLKSYLHRAVINTAINRIEKNKKFSLKLSFCNSIRRK